MYGSWNEIAVLENFFMIYLRPIRRFYGAYLFSKNANSKVKNLIDHFGGMILRIDFI